MVEEVIDVITNPKNTVKNAKNKQHLKKYKPLQESLKPRCVGLSDI